MFVPLRLTLDEAMCLSLIYRLLVTILILISSFPKKFAPVLLIPEDEQDNLMKIDDVEFRVTP